MEMMIERRADADGRIPLQVPVALQPHPSTTSAARTAEVFEAEAINLGAGGLSLRGRHTPDVGALLVCHFDVPPGEVPMEVQGEVVWAHRMDDGYGHFGLRFVSLPQERVALLSELLAEQTVRYSTMRAEPPMRQPAHESGAYDRSQGGAGELPRERVDTPAMAADEATYNPWAEQAVSNPSPAEDATRRVSMGGSAALELSVGASLQGELAAADHTGAMFMQTLDMLPLGDPTTLIGADGRSQSGSIADVRLVVYEGIPRLMIELAFDAAGASEAPVGQAATDDGDTVRDLAPPNPETGAGAAAEAGATDRVVRAERTSGARRTTVSEFDTDARVQDDGPDPFAPAGTRGEQRTVEASAAGADTGSFDDSSFIDGFYSEASGDVLADGDVGLGAQPTNALPAGADAAATARSDDEARAVRLQSADPGLAAGPEYGAHGGGDNGGDGADAANGGEAALTAMAGAAGRFTERLSSSATAGLRAVSSSWAMQVRTAKRAARHLARPAPRRTTGSRRRAAGSSGARQARAAGKLDRLRPMLMGALALGALALGAYALWPQSDADDFGQPPAALSALPVAPAPASAVPLIQGGAAAGQPVQGQPVQGQQGAAVGGVLGHGARPGVPRPASVPADSPYAVDVNAPVGAPALAESDPGPAFGADQVPDARRFTLRMTEKVNELRGVVDDGGFRVIIPDSHSLDRAGPIASAHAAIHRSMILNKDGRSELTVRFAEGRSPAYRVVGKGATLELLVAEK